MNKKSFLYFLVIVLSVTSLSCKKDNFIENKPPVVNAGTDASITLPVNSFTVSGSATDADGSVVAYLWSQVTGPAASTIIEPGSTTTKILFSTKGRYVFQLMATDNKGATGFDTMAIVVNQPVQQTLTLQPGNNPAERTLLNNNGSDQSQTGSPDIPVEAWTSGGNPYTVRGLIKFDLSSIPSTAAIVSAHLFLYSYPTPTLNGNLVDANFGTSNTLLVQQVAANWTPSSTTWFNQPSTTSVNQVIATQTSQSQLDLDLDVKDMVSNMVSTNTNYGFGLKLQTEVTYNSRIFVSSYNTTYTNKRPKLVVVYQ